MKRFLILFFLGASLLNASEVDKARATLEISKQEFAMQAESASLEKEKLLAEYANLQSKLKEAQGLYEESKKGGDSVESLEDSLEFLEGNLSKLEAKSESLNGDIFNFDKGEIDEEKLFAFPEKYIAREMLEEVESFFVGKSKLLPVDLSEGKIFEAKAKTFLEKLELGGIWIYPICFFAGISLIIVIMKFVEIMRVKILSRSDLDEFSRLMKTYDFNKAKMFSKKFSKPYRAMLKELFDDSKLSKNLLEEVSYENMLKVGDKLHRGLGFISVTASIAPLLGLLGTVTGIIKTFSDLAVYGNSNPNLLSSGISQALITTEFGLSLAIPAFVVYAYLSRRAKRVLSDMEKLASVFISSTKA